MDLANDTSNLKRDVHEMPEEIRSFLEARRLMSAYRARPAYQRNDYLGWIARARQPETRQRRLSQMLGELEKGGVYMHMVWKG